MTLIDPRKLQKPSKVQDKELREHQSWCFKNNIFIYPEPDGRYGEVRIVVNEKGNILRGAHLYRQYKLKKNDIRWHTVVEKLYTEYYNKYNSNGETI